MDAVEPALALAERIDRVAASGGGDPAFVAWHLACRMVALVATGGSLEVAFGLAGEAAATARDAGDWLGQGFLTYGCAVASMEIGCHEESLAHARAAAEHFQVRGATLYVIWCEVLIGHVLVVSGRPREALDVLSPLERTTERPIVLALVALARLAVGEEEGAARAASEVLAAAQPSPAATFAALALAEVELRRGAPAAARAVLDARPFRALARSPSTRRHEDVVYAEAAARSGDRAAATARIGRLRDAVRAQAEGLSTPALRASFLAATAPHLARADAIEASLRRSHEAPCVS